MRLPSFLVRRPLRIATMLAGGAVIALTLAACSGTAGAAQGAPSSAPSAGAPSRAPRAPGVSGVIAAAQADTLQVQGDGVQTAVHYTTATAVTTTEIVAASTIRVGDCVVAITASSGGAATTIAVSKPDSSGKCTPGLGGGRPGGGFGGNGARPSGTPADGRFPSGAPRRPSGSGGRGFGGFVVGTVTATAATQLTVSVEARGSATAGPRTITIDSATKITTAVPGKAADLVVGQCVTATGTSDTSGGFDAKTLTVSPPSSGGTCTNGFGRPPGAGSTGGGQNG